MLKNIHIKKFRKFKNIEFNIASRLTLISGANGIGKSTLLGIIANGSGTKTFRTLNNKDFHPEFKDYFILNKEEHIDARKSRDYYEVILSYDYKDIDIKKRVRTSHPNQSKLKLVPRTVDENGKNNENHSKVIEEKTGVTESGRVPLPTVYVSMNRLFPFGESGSSLDDIIKVSSRKHINDSDKIVSEYVNMYNKILPNSIDKDSVELYESHKPKIGYNAFYVMPSTERVLTQSIGQDSLSGILNAILSFKNISQEENYTGGILCIDELDASLHPDAQKRLIKLLKHEAEKLKIQIIFTSHSLTVIKEMIKLSRKSDNLYSVLYFRNLSNPYIKVEKSYAAVKADLFSETHFAIPEVKVYLEDAEAKFVFEQLISLYEEHITQDKSILSNCEIITSEISCSTLLNLPKKDDYFKDTIILLDSDAKYYKSPDIKEYLEIEPTGFNMITGIPDNVLFLPGNFSPEGELYKFLYYLCKNEEEHEPFWDYVETIEHGNYYPSIIKTKLDEMYKNNDLTRVPFKEWFKSYESFFKHSNIFKYQYIEMDNIESLKDFGNSFSSLLNKLTKRIQSRRF